MHPSRSLPTGQVVAGRYRVVQRLGGGGMGDVYLAEHALAGRMVALKLLRAELATDESLARRLFQEAQTVNRIRHPNIVDVLDAGFSDEGPYIVMELLEGCSVAQAIERVGRLPPKTALAIALPLLEALEAAHWRGVVHRDLKPENLFLADLGREVRLKILDFGIAKVTMRGEADASPQTQTGTIFGTPDYLSPEQAIGEGVVDGRSDVFAVATVLFELLTGARPFSAETMVATAYKIAHQEPPRLCDHGVDAPALQAALDAAMRKRPDDRLPSAAAFAELLTPLAEDEPERRRALRALLDRSQTAPPRPNARIEDETPPPPMPATVDAPSAEAESALPLTPTPSPDPRARAPLVTLTSGEPVRPAKPPPKPAPPPAAIAKAAPPRALPRWLFEGTDASASATPTPSPTPPPASGPRAQAPSSPTPTAPNASNPSAPRTPSRPQARIEPSAQPSGSRPRPPSPLGEPRRARGLLFRSVAQWIERAYGTTALTRVVERLPPVQAQAIRSDTFVALAWYPLAELDELLEAASGAVVGQNPEAWRKLAREHFDRGLASVLHPSGTTGDLERALRRAPSGWQRLLDFGETRVGSAMPKAGRMRVEIGVEGFEDASAALRNVHVGAMEAVARGAGAKDVAARIVAGDGGLGRELTYEITWSAR
jgi:serine/threonine-protein kinase